MSCLVANQNSNFDSLNGGIAGNCFYNIGGVKRIFVAPYEDLSNKYTVVDNKFYSANTVLNWQEIQLHKEGANFTETIQPDRSLQQVLEMIILQLNPNKRVSINALLSSKWFFIFQDYNGNHWFFALEGGTNKDLTEYQASTGFYAGENLYKFIFKASSKQTILAVSDTYVDAVLLLIPECSDLDGVLVQDADPFMINIYGDCIIGDIA